jgi:hypothetical protein
MKMFECFLGLGTPPIRKSGPKEFASGRNKETTKYKVILSNHDNNNNKHAGH